MSETSQTYTGSTGGCLLRLFWIMVGPAVLLIMGAVMIVHRPALGTWPGFVFLGWAAAVALARLLDREPAEGTAPGSAPLSGSRSRFLYMAVLTGVALLILALAHVAAPRFA